MKRFRKSRDRFGKAKDRSDQELRTIAIGVHVGRIVTNAQAAENQWRQYAVTRPPLIVEFLRLNRADLAKVKKFTKEIEAWEKGARPQIA
jgi:hypothetical protein